MADETNDVARLFARLRQEVQAAGPRRAHAPPSHVRLSARDQAERLWAVSAERPIVGISGPLRRVVRRLMRWYVEPALVEQRAFNDAVLKHYDHVDERISRLERPKRRVATGVRIAVCRPQVPFVYGGAEVVTDALVDELRARGHQAETVTVPFKWYPGSRVLDQAFLWRLLDLTEADGSEIDLVIATKFPAYCVRHANKVIWLQHQFRQAYDYDRTGLGQFSESAEDRATRDAVERLDRVALGEARKVFTISRNVAERLARSTGFEAQVLRPPAQALHYHTGEAEQYVLSVNRLDRAKRIDLLIEAAKVERSLRVVVVGEGPDRARLEQLAAEATGRIEFAGRVDDERLADLYARCLAVYYAPLDEDFGLVPYEAFLSEKPVVTTTDAGGPLEIVRDRETGVVVAPEPTELARACAYLAAHADEARAWGRAGKAIAERITWDSCIAALLS
jgi:glycosyltransferase involved in cell wall biosynthesis